MAKYNNQTLRWVTPYTSATVKYGFNSNSDLIAEFGHNLVTNQETLVGLVIGANSPKPPRAKISRLTGSDSSFCDISKVSILKQAGYSVQYGSVRLGQPVP
jgi:hypothetical protein